MFFTDVPKDHPFFGRIARPTILSTRGAPPRFPIPTECENCAGCALVPSEEGPVAMCVPNGHARLVLGATVDGHLALEVRYPCGVTFRQSLPDGKE